MLNVSAKSKIDPIPDGMYHGVCIGVIDLGTQYSPKFDTYAKKVLIMWEFPELMIKYEKNGVELEAPRVKSKTYTQSIGKKSNLYKDLVSWRGRVFTQEELGEFDVQKLMGVNCMIQIISEVSKKDGNTYANVAAILPLYKGIPPVKPFDKTYYFSFSDNTEVPEDIPEWIKETIGKSQEMKELNKAEMDVPDMPDTDNVPF